MADFSSTYQQALKLVEEFLKNAKEFTKENEERLKRIGEIADILACMEKEKDASSDVKQCTEGIQSLFGTLLFGCYMEITSQIADRSSMIKEVENKQKEEESSELPKAMQIKFDEVKQYLEKANGRMKQIDDLLSELIPKVRAYFLLILYSFFRVNATLENTL